MVGLYNRPHECDAGLRVGRRLPASPRPHQRIDHQNDTVVVSVTSRGSPTAMIRLLLLDG